MAKGKLIVLEGIDGSGKSAQYRRLCKRMEKMELRILILSSRAMTRRAAR